MTNKWSSAGHLIQDMAMAASVVYKNDMYVFGGSDGKDNRVDIVQVYNLAHQSCMLLDQCMPYALDCWHAMMWEMSVIRMQCLIYLVSNFEMKAWQERKEFKLNVYYFGLLLDNQTIYIRGGGIGRQDQDNKLIWMCMAQIKSVSIIQNKIGNG